MRLIRRREFLHGAGATLALVGVPAAWARAAYAAAGKSVSKRDPQFEVGLIYDWYQKSFFDFSTRLSSAEKRFVGRCMEINNDSWTRVMNENFAYSLFSFSHRIVGSRVNSSRMFFAVGDHVPELQRSMEEIAAQRGIKAATIPEFERSVGLGWDMEAGHFKVYMLLEDLGAVGDPDMRGLIAKAGDEAKYNIGLASVTLKDGAILEKKVYVALKEPRPHWVKDYPFRDEITHTNLMITDRRGVVPQVDLTTASTCSSGARQLHTHLNDMASRVADRYRRNFNIEVDTITYNGPDDYTIYFPG